MTVVARAKTRAKPKAGSKAKASRWRLYYVTDAADFECDFVIAKSAAGAERLFTAEYGDLRGDAELVVEIDKPPESLTKGCWLGPDPDLTEFGGTKLPRSTSRCGNSAAASGALGRRWRLGIRSSRSDSRRSGGLPSRTLERAAHRRLRPRLGSAKHLKDARRAPRAAARPCGNRSSRV
jgi:hypothetical protein